ncbi:MAG TPA: hypothetical protein VLA61_15010 [Ideonella sp.]|uniref:hypothetical protein n=1 Tax=Ideonella sp. TaxID=1929293 RepID=UPI002C0DC10A|nr:hypothetical protein [Ideonella sp.]HSI49580.1 hypothetical protein [Ideonella sp.]
MALTDEQRQAIREEEQFRLQLREELANSLPRAAPGPLERLAAFFDTKAGFWLLTTVLASVTATGFGTLQRYLDRNEIREREVAEATRRDTETLLKLGPMLTSDNRSQVDMAIVLLDGLTARKGVDDVVAGQVRRLFQATLTAGLKSDASDPEKTQAQAIIAFADSARTAAIQRPGAAASEPAATQASVSAAVDQLTLPVRVYLQIGSDDDRPRATAALEALRQAGLIAPGVERVPPSSAPRSNELRYCGDKVDPAALQRVREAVAAAVSPPPAEKVLQPSQCGKVRANHFEVWYARAAP